MRSILVYDLPLRLFHWAFAGALTASLGIALLVDEHSPLFAWLMLFGLAAGFLLLLRVSGKNATGGTAIVEVYEAR